MNREGTFIKFEYEGDSSSGKTSTWGIFTKEGTRDFLGSIRWYSKWRKYAFFPYHNTLFEQTCLKEIANFIEERMNERKEKK